MEKLMVIGLIGYITGLVGFFAGTVFSIATYKLGAKYIGCLMGFTAGLLIAFTCFEMLPVAFENNGLTVAVVGIIAGVAVTAIIENRVSHSRAVGGFGEKTNMLKTGIMLGIGIMLHKLPEGMAIGSLLNYNMAAGLSMCVIVSIHCFPEAIAVSLPMKASGMKYSKMFLSCFVICLPMAIGSVLGAVLSNISDVFVSLCLSFSGGIMIYISCGEIIPESKTMWKGTLSSLGAAFGFVVGVVLTANI